MFEIWLKSDEFEGTKSFGAFKLIRFQPNFGPKPPSKIDDICRFLAGVDDDLDVPGWGWCH